MEKCPKCQSKRVRRSRTRPGLERVRRTLTGKAPFRCQDCNWRGWAFDFGDSHATMGLGGQPDGPDPDLSEIDKEIEQAKAARKEPVLE